MKQYYYGERYDEGTGPLCCAKFPHAAGLHWRDKPEAFKREIPGMVTQEEDKPAPAQDEREAFEAWMVEVEGSRIRPRFDRVTAGLFADEYRDGQIQGAWNVWQARAARPAQTAPQCNHRFMYFGDQTKRRCADCCVVEGNEQTAPQPENKPGLGVNWRSVARSQASVIEQLQERLIDRDKEQQELRDEIMQLKAWLDHANAINSELLRGLKAITFVDSNNELHLRSTSEVIGTYFGSKSLLCLGVKC